MSVSDQILIGGAGGPASRYRAFCQELQLTGQVEHGSVGDEMTRDGNAYHRNGAKANPLQPVSKHRVSKKNMHQACIGPWIGRPTRRVHSDGVREANGHRC